VSFADVVFDPTIVHSLVCVLRQLMEPMSSQSAACVAYIASTVRNEDTRDAFLIALGKLTLCMVVILDDFFFVAIG
jgi:hypothetical protein